MKAKRNDEGIGAALNASETWVRDELVELIEIESLSGQEHAIVEHLMARSEALGFPVEAIPVPGGASNLLIGWDKKPDLVLTAHVDTIVPHWEWAGKATVDGDRVYGLGAQDDKACVVACLLALILARGENHDLGGRSVGVVLTVDEEVGGTGSKHIAEALGPTFVVATEGTELDIAVVESGTIYAWVFVQGRAVHGSLADEGDNAIEKAAALIGELPHLPFANVVHPIAGRSLPNVRQITGGSNLNAIPDAASFRLNVRVNPGVSTEDVIAQLSGLCERYDARMELEEASEGFETPTEASLVEALMQATEERTGRRPGLTRMTAWTDGHEFAERGAQVVIFGPGHLRNAHRPDESVLVSETVACAQAMAGLILHSDSLTRGV